MSDSLGSVLASIDMSAMAIQNSAAAMMKHYDRSASVAVTEWRNALHNCTDEQLLPLVYVANEVLQTSKRNRGVKFLEAFSPVLGQALIHVCQRNPGAVEKVRRTAKIWGERRVFSIRFVNELLNGLEKMRHNSDKKPESPTPAPLAAPFSPVKDEESTSISNKDTSAADTDDDDGSQKDSDNEPSTQADFDSFLGEENSAPQLDFDVSIDSLVANAAISSAPTSKRRRSAGSKAKGQLGKKQKKRRPSILSTTSLMEVWNQTSMLRTRFDTAVSQIKATIIPEHTDTNAINVESLVGDELLDEYKKLLLAQKSAQQQRLSLHRIANETKDLEKQAVRYIPWLRSLKQQDDDDVQFCNDLERKLLLIKTIHNEVQVAHRQRKKKEAELQAKREAELQKEKEEEEKRAFMEAALKKETEARPGMVWNRATGEYQELNTNEDWRD